MEEIIKIGIYIHAFFGGLGLITGIGSILVKKGGKSHKKMGKLFSIGMLTSSLISIPISWMPNHKNLFLFLIGLFTIYLVLTGNRALKFKRKRTATWVDKTICGSMFFFSLCMIVIGFYKMINSNSISILYLFFGSIGVFLTLRDFNFYKNLKKEKTKWLMVHISKMVGALIASVTAFIIAGIGIGSLVAWLLPTILGTLYIVYWIRRIKK